MASDTADMKPHTCYAGESTLKKPLEKQNLKMALFTDIATFR